MTPDKYLFASLYLPLPPSTPLYLPVPLYLPLPPFLRQHGPVNCCNSLSGAASHVGMRAFCAGAGVGGELQTAFKMRTGVTLEKWRGR